MRRTSIVVVGLVTLLAACNASGTHVSEGSAPLATIPATTVPAPTTTTLAPPGPTIPSATAAAAATVRSETVRVCPQPAVPAGVETELATPNAPNLAYSASAGGPTAGHVANPWGGPSTRPVVSQQDGWVQIPLYTRPNGSTGWVPSQNVTVTTTPYLVVVSICLRTLTLYQGSQAVYSSPVGVGQPRWPTPLGSTFVDAIVTTPRRQVSTYGPTVFMLGTHSNVFTDFDGGDGVVAIHGFPSDEASTRGVASSHGCVRANPTTITTLRGAIPVGTPVDIVA